MALNHSGTGKAKDNVDLSLLPKIELHLHLDCSLGFDVVRRLDPEVDETGFRNRFLLDEKCRDLGQFLSRTVHPLQIMQTEQGLRWVTLDLFRQMQREHTLYAEIRFAPLQHLERGLKPEQVVRIVEEELSSAVAETGIEARLILCTLRHFTREQSLETARLVAEFKGTRVAGLDLAGAEAHFPVEVHEPAFRYARKENIPRTAHAGEALGAESVRQTLEKLKPNRIGHGVRSIEDPSLLQVLREQSVHLEVCPTCNVIIDVFEDMASHPVDRLFRAGIPLSINTDGKTLPFTDLNSEYRQLQEVFGWSRPEFLKCNLAAVEGAFIPESLKKNLAQKLKLGYS